MTSRVYPCIVCQQPNASVTDLHNHHIQYHTAEELSHTVISLQGFKTLKSPNIINNKPLNYCTNESKLNDNNNNEKSYNHATIKTENQNKNDETTALKTNYRQEKESGHNKAHCSVNCGQFAAWEHELNKKLKINDNDFLKCVNSLCNDLQNVRRKVKKRKNHEKMNGTSVKNAVQYNKNDKVTKTEVKKESSGTSTKDSVQYNENDKLAKIEVKEESSGTSTKVSVRCNENDKLTKTEVKEEFSSPSTKDSVQCNENDKVIKTEVKEEFNDLTFQSALATTSSYDSVTSDTVINDEVLNIRIQSEANTEYDYDEESLTVIEIDTDRNLLTYNPINGNFSWNSIFPLDSDLTDILSKYQTDTVSGSEDTDN